MSHSGPDSAVCYNCGTPLVGAFCAACGQRALPLNPRFRDFLHEFTHEMLHVDGKIFASVRTLLLSPGRLTCEQFAGRRAHWISPIRLYLLFSLMYFGITSFTATNPVRVRITSPSEAETASELRKLGFENERQFQDALAHAHAKWAPRVMFVLVPAFAWLVQVASRHTRRNYPQHLYFALHVHAAWFAAGVAAAAVAYAAPPLIGRIGEALALAYAVFYGIAAYRAAYGTAVKRAIVRVTGVLLVYWIVVIGASLAIVLPVIFGRV
jgi:hypothetical protein